MKEINPHDEIKGSISTPEGKESLRAASVALVGSVAKFVSDCTKRAVIVRKSNRRLCFEAKNGVRNNSCGFSRLTVYTSSYNFHFLDFN
jgi:hypothetical protein